MTPNDLRHWREASRLTQTDLSRLLGVSVATVCRWERARLKNPPPPLPIWLPLAIRGLSGLPSDSRN